MKPIHFQKKYNLLKGINFDYSAFSVDFARKAMGIFEYYSESDRWGYDMYWNVVHGEIRDIFDAIDCKTAGKLPERIWDSLYDDVFVPDSRQRFPGAAKYIDSVRNMNIYDLFSALSDYADHPVYEKDLRFIFSGYRRRSGYDYESSPHFSWVPSRHDFSSTNIGDLPLTPCYLMSKLLKLEPYGNYMIDSLIDEYNYQSRKIAASRAKIKFRKEQEYRERYQRDQWDWFEYVKANMFNRLLKDSIVGEYVRSFEYMGLDMNMCTADDVAKAYKKMSLTHHPDTSQGSKEKFQSLYEHKIKCLEYVKVR